MLRLPKYKIYNKVKTISQFPLRILKFKRPKWHFLQANLVSRKKLGKSLTDVTKAKENAKVWKRIESYYKDRIKTYSFLSAIFRHSVNLKKLKSIKKIKNRKNLYLTYIFNFYYKLCNLIFITNMVTSSFEAKQRIASRSLFINNKVASSNSILKKGDFVHLNSTNVNIFDVSKKFNSTLSVLTNFEVDYYSQNLVVVKDPVELSKEDFYLLSLDYLNIQKLI